MAKQRKNTSVIPAKAGIQEEADQRLCEISIYTKRLADLRSEYEMEINEVMGKYADQIKTIDAIIKSGELMLMQTMKKNKGVLFDGTDVVNLSHGSLIRETGKKVTIPKTALEACKENKFTDVIKVVESLDRDAIEKWPDAKLVLIGAERKPKEEFKYNLKVTSPVKEK
jgi:uncharacterized Fe-S center protein